MVAIPKAFSVKRQIGDNEITFETGRLARQASGSVLMSCGESMVLVTAVAGGHRDDARFFPLVVDYVEKQYAAGKIPGGFLKREGRLSESEILTCRLIDRPIRPLFPDGYKGDTQIIATVLSHDGEHDTDVLAITGASAALTLSHAPFMGPIAGVRVAKVDGELIANPTLSQQAEADINIVMACTDNAVVMVEGESEEASEEEMLDAIDFGFNAAQPLITAQLELQVAHGKDKLEFVGEQVDKKLFSAVDKFATKPLRQAFKLHEKAARRDAIAAVAASALEALAPKFEGLEADIKSAFDDITKREARELVLRTGKRLDGRTPVDVRTITCEAGLLPRTHGSALFTRGETQALAVATMGTGRDAQMIDALTGKRDEYFMLHYNFPPFSVGEVRPLRGAGRREIGHGFLANKALRPVLPTFEEFGYTIRLVSEVLESNGSSSMATICGGSMALMDAGIPIKGAVAGIAMGLIMEGKRYAILSDILGDEDHLGDMDFKVAGTGKGITALQMDIKIKGLSRDLLSEALHQAREGRLHILGEMNKEIASTRDDISDHAPRVTSIQISTDKIRDVIGAGGKTIRSIVDRTGAQIEVDDLGVVKISSSSMEATEEAIEIIKDLTREPVVGEVYLGVVSKVTDFGCFVTILPGTDGLCHISELAEGRVENVEDIVREGEELIVKVVGLERGGKIRLSRKEALGLEPTVSVLRTDI